MSKILYGNNIDTLWLTGPNPRPNGILSFFGLTDFSFFVNFHDHFHWQLT